MLGNFTYDIPTRIHFGKDALEQLGPELAKVGPTVMLTYGRSSIKKMVSMTRLWLSLRALARL